MSEAARYPQELVHPVTTTDGVRALIRPIRAEDADRLIALYDRLSRHTAYQRFFTIMKRLPPDWARMLRRLALVVEPEGPGDDVVGVARYEPTDRADTAEVAFVLQDGWQNRGLGTVLLRDLLAAAEARGIHRFCAWVLADNTRMLDLLTRFTTIVERKLEQGVVEVTFTTR